MLGAASVYARHPQFRRRRAPTSVDFEAGFPTRREAVQSTLAIDDVRLDALQRAHRATGAK